MDNAFSDVFATPNEFIRAGFAKVVAPIQMPLETKKIIYASYFALHKSGSAHREVVKVIGKHLEGIAWKWPWFDLWLEKFTKADIWPPEWYQYREALTNYIPKQPSSIREALPRFSVRLLKEWLAREGIKVKPTKLRADFESEFEANVTWDKFKPTAIEKYLDDIDGIENSHAIDKEEARIALLAITITSKICRLQDEHRIQAVMPRFKMLIVPHPEDEPFAREFARRFNSGESDELPPYYPGDGSWIKSTRA